MKKFAMTLISVLALALFTAGCDVLDPPQYGALEVLVADQDDQPIAQATVAIWSMDQIRRGGETSAEGIWVQKDLRKGNYRVEVLGAARSCHVKAAELNSCRLVVEGQ